MFTKFHVHTREAKPRLVQPVRSGIIDWTGGCIGCVRCVKRICPQGAYMARRPDPLTLQDNLDLSCADCFRCVQSCPERLIQKTINPEYEALGDSYWTPKIIDSTWAQATDGRIPVSGAGYGGTFSGPGFDAMWTDMSEIVRPTRDGIHGREYISTAIQLGRRHHHLEFDAEGQLVEPSPPHAEIPLPILFMMPRGIEFGPAVTDAVAKAAQELGTFFLAPAASEIAGDFVPVYEAVPAEWRRVFWLTGGAASAEGIREAGKAFPEAVVGLGLEFDDSSVGRVVELTREGAGLIHLAADDHGRIGSGGESGRFIKEAIREIHLALVAEGLRDQVTLLVSGGVAMAEHVAKAIICGMDGVVLDWPLLIALGCQYCGECHPQECPVLINEVERNWAAQRIINLVGAWRDQLLEVLGAMGLR